MPGSAQIDRGKIRNRQTKRSRTKPVDGKPLISILSITLGVYVCGVVLTLAAKVNSRSSERNVLSSMAVSIASSRSSGLRNRYSVTPSHRRKS